MNEIPRDNKALRDYSAARLMKKNKEVITIDIERYKALVEENKRLKSGIDTLSQRCAQYENDIENLKLKVRERTGQLRGALMKGKRAILHAREYRDRLLALRKKKESLLLMIQEQSKQVEQYRLWVDELKDEMAEERRFYADKLQEAWKEADRSWWRRLFRRR